MTCPKCGADNFGYFKAADGHYYFTSCRCPIPTVRQIAIKRGMITESEPLRTTAHK